MWSLPGMVTPSHGDTGWVPLPPPPTRIKDPVILLRLIKNYFNFEIRDIRILPGLILTEIF